ncbi:MAG: 30S ribosomal protein S6 [Isosphaeraceae bacterium]
MPVNTYEGMFLLDSAKVAADWEGSVHQVHEILSKYEAEIVAFRQWDERRLAYAIQGHKKGTYLLTYFKADGSKLSDITHDCALNDLILRNLIQRIHPKLVEHLVTQAMNSNPHAEEDGPAPEEDRDDRRGRRRRDD